MEKIKMHVQQIYNKRELCIASEMYKKTTVFVTIRERNRVGGRN